MYTAREIYALLTMQDLVNQLQPGLLDEHLGPLRERLKLLLGREDLRPDEIRRRIRILHMASRPVEPRFFSLVTQATLTRRRLHIRYYTRTRDEFTEREVSPQRIVFYRGNWYLDAWCHLRQDLRSFAIDAIQQVSISDKAARELQTGALDAHLGAGYGIFSGAADQEAVLRFEPAVARYIVAEQWHANQAQILEPGGHLILKVPFSNQQELIMDIMRYGPDVQVLAPQSLRHQVKVRLKGQPRAVLRLPNTETPSFFEVAHSVSHSRVHNWGFMRFIHSGDWQIGMRAVHGGIAAEAVRAARLTTAARVCRLAAEEAVDFLLLAGDTFEDNAVDRDLVERVAGLLEGAGCPVYVLPGNHDPIQPGCVWEHEVWRSARNISVLSEASPVPVQGGILMPCPLRVRRSREDPTAAPTGSTCSLHSAATW